MSCFFQALFAASRSRLEKTMLKTSEYQLTGWPSMPSLIFLYNVSVCLNQERGDGTYFRKFQPVRHVVSWEEDLLRAGTAGSDCLFTEASNTENLSSDCQLSGHCDGGVKRVVQCKREQRGCHCDTGRWSYKLILVS